MRKITFIYWDTRVFSIAGVFRALGWRVDLVHFLDFNLDSHSEAEVFFAVLPKKLSNDFLKLVLGLKLKNKKPFLFLDNCFSIERKRLLLSHGVDFYFANPVSIPDLAKYACFQVLDSSSLVRYLEYKDILLDLNTRKIIRGDQSHGLRRKEFDLLKLLLENHGLVLSKTRILESVWDMNVDLSTTTLESHICALRKKLDKGFLVKRLHTVHCVGYKIE